MRNYDIILISSGTSSTFHGVRHITTYRAIKTARGIFWMLVFLLAMIGTVVQVSILVARYFKYPVITEAKEIFQEVEFPAITFCNLNSVRDSQKDLGGADFVNALGEYDAAVQNDMSGGRRRRRKREVDQQGSNAHNIEAPIRQKREDCPGFESWTLRNWKLTILCFFIAGNGSFTQAKSQCETNTTRLAHVTSSMIADTIKNKVGEDVEHWISLEYIDGAWKHADGTDLSWSGWVEEDNYPTNEFTCGYQTSVEVITENKSTKMRGKWRNDEACSSQFVYVCEVIDYKSPAPAPNPTPPPLTDPQEENGVTTPFHFLQETQTEHNHENHIHPTGTSTTVYDATTDRYNSVSDWMPQEDNTITASETVPESVLIQAEQTIPAENKVPFSDASDSFFLPEVDLTDKPWFDSSSPPSPVVENAEQFKNLITSVEPEVRKEMGHQIERMLQFCSYNGESCAPGHFTDYYDKVHGNCYTFNKRQNGTLSMATRSGPLYGLTIEIYIEQQEYVASLSSTAGIRLSIHHADLQPFPAEDGITVGPGAKTAITLKMRKLAKMEPPYNNCTQQEWNYIHMSGKYTIKSCQKECIQEGIVAKCSCYDTTLEYNGTVPACGSEDQDCLSSVFENYMSQNLACECSDPCRDELYLAALSSSEWPGQAHKETLKHNLLIQDPTLAEILEQANVIERNFLKLEIFFDEIKYVETTETPAYPAPSLLADIGGQLGLWVGVSFLSFMEIFELIVLLVNHKLNGSVPLEGIRSREMDMIQSEVDGMQDEMGVEEKVMKSGQDGHGQGMSLQLGDDIPGSFDEDLYESAGYVSQSRDVSAVSTGSVTARDITITPVQ